MENLENQRVAAAKIEPSVAAHDLAPGTASPA
jgi:hypothetical protein